MWRAAATMTMTAKIISRTGSCGAHMSTITNWAEPANTERFITNSSSQLTSFWAAKAPSTLP
jgi:hypothetical protein